VCKVETDLGGISLREHGIVSPCVEEAIYRLGTFRADHRNGYERARPDPPASKWQDRLFGID
jgi:hypothetical protein